MGPSLPLMTACLVSVLATECVFVGSVPNPIANLDASGGLASSVAPPSPAFEGVAVQDDALSNSTLWVAVGYQAFSRGAVSDDSDPVVVWSNDGVNFVNASSVPLNGAIRNVWYSGVSTSSVESVFVLVGCCGPSSPFRAGPFTMAYSFDARVWTGISAFQEIGQDVFYSAQKNLWIAVGSSLGSGGFDVAYQYGSPKVASWPVVRVSILGTGRGITYSINHDMWFVVGDGSPAGGSAKIAFTRDPTNPSSWRVVPSSATLFGGAGFRIAAFNGTVIAVGDGRLTGTSMGVFYAPTMTDSDVPVFVPSSEGTSFFDIGRGVYYSFVKKKWFAVGRNSSSGLSPAAIESQNPIPSVLSWAATPNSAALSKGRSVVCIPLPVEQVLSSKLIMPLVTQTSGTLLEGNVVGTSNDRTTVLGDWSVHGQMRLGSNFSVGGVMAVVGSLTTLANASSTCGGLFVIGKGATLTIEVRGPPRSALFDVQVAQYAGISGSFSNLSVTSVDDGGCNNQFAFGAPLYGPNALSLTISLQSSGCSEGLSLGAMIGIVCGGIAVAVAAVLLLVWIMVRHRQNLTLQLQQKLHQQQCTPYMEMK
jgi:hypothetical protein